MIGDRAVHARDSATGMEIVRYEKAGKWFVEYPPAALKPRRRVSVSEAAKLAHEMPALTGVIFLGFYGGRVFDRKVRDLL